MLIKTDDEAHESSFSLDAAMVKAEINLMTMKAIGSKETIDKRLMHLYCYKNKQNLTSDLQ